MLAAKGAAGFWALEKGEDDDSGREGESGCAAMLGRSGEEGALVRPTGEGDVV